MKIDNSSNSTTSNKFAFFFENKMTSLPKKCITKTRPELSRNNIFKINNDDPQKYEFNYFSKKKPLQYPQFFDNSSKKTDYYELAKMINSRKSIPNRIPSAKNYEIQNAMNNATKNEGNKIAHENNDISLNKNKIVNKEKNENDKELFDSEFNLILDNWGNDDISNILKEIASLKIASPSKNKSEKDKFEEKIYTNTGDSFDRCSCDQIKNPFCQNPYKI